MPIDIKTVATINLAIQILLFLFASGAVYLAKNRDLSRHCTFMRVLIPIQIIAIAFVMLPSMLGYLKIVNPPLFNIEMLIHHTFGLAVVVIWIYINLVFGKSWMPRNFRAVMRSAFAIWILALLFGVSMYIRIWT
ncbi:Uncharacterised protein [uncultured archaeon]|nr:Uncharacterised protein [uncultured archaeon]